jgi:hypothetical protein
MNARLTEIRQIDFEGEQLADEIESDEGRSTGGMFCSYYGVENGKMPLSVKNVERKLFRFKK